MAATQRFIDEETGKRLSRRALSPLRATRTEQRLKTEAAPPTPPTPAYDSTAVAEAYKRRVLSGKPDSSPAGASSGQSRRSRAGAGRRRWCRTNIRCLSEREARVKKYVRIFSADRQRGRGDADHKSCSGSDQPLGPPAEDGIDS